MLEGVHNFRDYGGYAVSGGGRVKRKVLWRSGQHYGASDADLGKIAALGLANVYDLRSSKERTTHPCRRPEGFAAEIYLSADRAEANAPHISAASMEPSKRTAETVREGMRRNYGRIAFRPELVASIGQMLAGHAAGKGNSLVNCMAGKDRTGIAVAALHLALGVHRDDIVEDYLLTNSAGNQAARLAAGADTIKAISGQMPEDVLRVLMGVEAEYLESAFAAMISEHGSTDGYLRDVIGVDDTMRGKLREQLVEG